LQRRDIDKYITHQYHSGWTKGLKRWRDSPPLAPGEETSIDQMKNELRRAKNHKKGKSSSQGSDEGSGSILSHKAQRAANGLKSSMRDEKRIDKRKHQLIEEENKGQ